MFVISDINECVEQNPCFSQGATCVNTWGGYSCITGVFRRKCGGQVVGALSLGSLMFAAE